MNHLHASWLEYYTMFSLNRGWIRVERVRANAIQYNRLSRKEVSERLLFVSLCDVVDAILVFFFSWLQQHKHKKEVSERFVGLLTLMEPVQLWRTESANIKFKIYIKWRNEQIHMLLNVQKQYLKWM